ncbi:hypothetical protein CPELA_08405 [Corynebacterium pelargi]|uniref:Uncharacterized protein n=1 Tax=Corynebacterium pelargi TaxID=1471400 RepID=A0A410WAH8_9CORY|nr:hypothetical protein CPELA_08405 [Corynebacterium pelargi]
MGYLLLLIGIVHHLEMRATGGFSLRAMHWMIPANIFTLAELWLFDAGASGLAYCLGQGGEVFVVFFEGVYAQQFPAKWCGDFRSVVFAKIPAMWVAARSQRTYNGGGLRVGIGQRCNGWLTAAWSGASAKVIHAHRV